jgi:glycosyltransferase involved in cell wall biosynthesis
MRLFLIEPHAGGRISGGYLYNARLAESDGAIERQAVRPEQLAADLEALELPAPAWVLADSLFLTLEHMAAFRLLRQRSDLRLGLLLHALPSFIRCAEERAQLARSLPLRPSAQELALLAELDLVVAPGPYLPRLLRECGSPVPTVICPPGVDPTSTGVGEAPRSRGPVQLISIGSVTPLKGLLDLAEALSRLGAADFCWTIVGHLGVNPGHVAELQQRIAALGLSRRVLFAGQLGHEQTLAALRRSDLLALTSFTENHPLVALEALAARVPVVGYAVGGLPDIIRHGEAGLLSPLLEVPRLTENLARLIADAGERRQLSEGCAVAARGLMTWSEAAHHFVLTLRERA